jgi:hypothetical protein
MLGARTSGAGSADVPSALSAKREQAFGGRDRAGVKGKELSELRSLCGRDVRAPGNQI